MTWTSSTPHEPGWYWWRDSEKFSATAVSVMYDPNDRLQARGGYWKYAESVSELGGQWSSTAITPPEETGG